MIDNYYFLVPNSLPQYSAIIDAARNFHRSRVPAWVDISLVIGLTETMAKVTGGNRNWFNKLPRAAQMAFIGQQGDPTADTARFSWYAQNFSDLE